MTLSALTTLEKFMILRELIEYLEKEDQNKIVTMGFSNPHSYRGIYRELAFEPTINIAVSDMLKAAKSAMGETYTGYKGGDFTMNEYTNVHLAEYGNCGEEIGYILLNYMLRKD